MDDAKKIIQDLKTKNVHSLGRLEELEKLLDGTSIGSGGTK